MSEPIFVDPSGDPFYPPEVSVEVGCLHCGQIYQSSEISWETRQCADGKWHGFWVCPIEGCDGAGFGFDILPTDPHYRDERGGWVLDDEDDFEDACEVDDDFGAEFDPDNSDVADAPS